MSGLDQFRANVAAVVASSDPNVGRVLMDQPRWQTLGELASGGTVKLAAGGSFDDDARAGSTATRFWSIDGTTVALPETNGTDDHRHTATAHGFFAAFGDAQESALRSAASAIVRALLAAQWTTLAQGMGEGYEGFLGDLPRIAASVTPARIGDGDNAVAGFAVDVAVTCHEERAR